MLKPELLAKVASLEEQISDAQRKLEEERIGRRDERSKMHEDMKSMKDSWEEEKRMLKDETSSLRWKFEEEFRQA